MVFIYCLVQSCDFYNELLDSWKGFVSLMEVNKFSASFKHYNVFFLIRSQHQPSGFESPFISDPYVCHFCGSTFTINKNTSFVVASILHENIRIRHGRQPGHRAIIYGTPFLAGSDLIRGDVEQPQPCRVSLCIREIQPLFVLLRLEKASRNMGRYTWDTFTSLFGWRVKKQNRGKSSYSATKK